MDLTGLETLLLSDTSKITELNIKGYKYNGRPPAIGLTHVLQALARRPTLTKLELLDCPLGRDEAILLQMALCNVPSLHFLALRSRSLETAALAELAPALYHNTSIKVLDLSGNSLDGMESAEFLRNIIGRNKTITALDLSGNRFGETTGAVECIADGLGSNSTLLKINISRCGLRDGQKLGSRNRTLQELTLAKNNITYTGVGLLLDTMEQNNHITDLDLQCSPIGNEGESLLARSLGKNALPNLIRLSLLNCCIDDDWLIALVSALEQNTSLLHLDLRSNHAVSVRAILALAGSLPAITVLQRVDLIWCTGLAPAMPLLLAGLRTNTSLFQFHVTNCAPSSVPPTPHETSRYVGGWIQEMERLGYRNRFLSLLRAPKERLPPRDGIWPHALARVVILPDVIFQVLGFKPNLVPSEDTEGKEAANNRKRQAR
jgi:hypothetical protein